MTAVLIMAGGKSTRMRSTGDQCHKALRTVLGVSLLERNLSHALAAGFRDIFVAVSSHEPSIHAFLSSRGQELATRNQAAISALVEKEPLGTIGIAQRLGALACDIVVLNVDNLTTLNLTAFVAHHQTNKAAMTIATHFQGFQVPLGEVVCDNGRITAYLEKPVHPVRISSGAYVLASRTCNWIENGRRVDIPQLIPMLHAKGESVAAFEHDSLWIDINDADALQRAETLVAEHRQEFSYPLPRGMP